MKRHLHLPSPATIIASLALTAALGGTSYAAVNPTGDNSQDSSPSGASVDDNSTSGQDLEQSSTDLESAAAIPSGTTVRGVWGGRYFAHAAIGAGRNSYLLTNSLPSSAPVGLRQDQVNTAPGDATCTGSLNNPTAPKRKVCLYINQARLQNATVAGFNMSVSNTPTGADRLGFIVRLIDRGALNASMRAEGTWAYTAP